MVKVLASMALAALVVSMATGAAPAAASNAQNGQLHIAKDCSNYTGAAGSYCTIQSSNLEAIPVGTRVFYDQAYGIPAPNGPSSNGMLDSNIVPVRSCYGRELYLIAQTAEMTYQPFNRISPRRVAREDHRRQRLIATSAARTRRRQRFESPPSGWRSKLSSGPSGRPRPPPDSAATRRPPGSTTPSPDRTGRLREPSGAGDSDSPRQGRDTGDGCWPPPLVAARSRPSSRARVDCSGS